MKVSLKKDEIFNFKSENICNFTSRKSFSKFIIVVIQEDFAQNIKKPKNYSIFENMQSFRA